MAFVWNTSIEAQQLLFIETRVKRLLFSRTTTYCLPSVLEPVLEHVTDIKK